MTTLQDASTSHTRPTYVLNRLLQSSFHTEPIKLPTRNDADQPFAPVAILEWSVSQHVCAAAWPRSRERSAQNKSPGRRFDPIIYQFGVSGRNKLLEEGKRLVEHQNAPLVNFEDPDSYQDQCQLWTAARRYLPRRPRRGGFTLLLCHAGGFQCESFETMLAFLLASPAGEHVDEIWALDSVTNGDSAILNQETMGDTFSWIDNGRDVSNFLLRFLPQKGTRQLPEHLEEQHVERDALGLDFRKRPSTFKGRLRGHRILGVGQSFGGAAIALAEIACPGLFSALAFLDAMLTHPPAFEEQAARWTFGESAIAAVLGRRENWPDRATMAESYSRNGVLAAHHPDVLRRYVDFATIQAEDGSIQLKCRKQQEALLFIEARSSVCAAGQRLHELHPRLKQRTLFVLASKSGSWVLERDHELNTQATKGSYTERVKSGHLIVQENPEAVAQSLGRFLDRLHSQRANL